MKKMQKQARQGDVFLRVVDGEPTGQEVPREGERIILAHGEATGHAHAIEALDVALLMDETTLARHLDTRSARRAPILDHEEHEAIKLPSGIIEVRQQREYHPAGLRRVLD